MSGWYRSVSAYDQFTILNWNPQPRRRRLLTMKGTMLRVFQPLMRCVQAAFGAQALGWTLPVSRSNSSPR